MKHSHSWNPKLDHVLIDNESHSAVGSNKTGLEDTPCLTLAFLTRVWFLVHHVPPLASVNPAVTSSVHPSPGSSPILPIKSMIVPFFESDIASLPVKFIGEGYDGAAWLPRL